MTIKKTAAVHRSTHQVPEPSAYHALDALLHTMRCIAQYEDRLCELSHELKRSGKLSSKMNGDLRAILEEIPSHDYLMDVEAVRASLLISESSPKFGFSKSPKPVRVRETSTAAKKKPRRKSSK